MKKTIFNFIASNFITELRDDFKPVLLVIFALIAAAAVVYGVYLGFLLAKAEDHEKRKQARRRMLMTLSSLMIIIILTVVFVSWNPGEVYDRENIAMGRASNYALSTSVFAFSPNGSYPLTMTFREMPMDTDYLEVNWGTATFAGPPQKTASITFDSATGKYMFNYPGATPPDSVEAYHFTATITVVIDGEVVTVNVPLAVLIYNPAATTAPDPIRPQGQPEDTAITPPSGGTSGGSGGSGGTVNPNPGAGGEYDFAWPVPIVGTDLHGLVNSPLRNPNYGCTRCQSIGTSRTDHNGVDISAGKLGMYGSSTIPLYAMAAGKVSAIVNNVTIWSACPDDGPSDPFRSWSSCRGHKIGAADCPNPATHETSCRHASGTASGNYVTIKHDQKIDGKDVYSQYLHMYPPKPNDPHHSNNMKVGDTITKGQHIGIMGTTGHSTGIHLHWNMKIGGVNVCPAFYY